MVVIQAHNHNPLDFLRQNTRADVVGALGALDAEFGPDIFRLCAVSHGVPGCSRSWQGGVFGA